jgi:hypothetical protein
MRKSLKIKFIIILAFILSLCIFPACKIGMTPIDDQISNFGGDATVNYYANEGYFNDLRDTRVMRIYYKSGFPVYEIVEKDPDKQSSGETSNVTQGLPFIKMDTLILDGWYHAKVDTNGNPIYVDETKNAIVLDETRPVDFSTIKSGDVWYIGAKWVEDVKLEYRIVLDTGVTVTDKDGNTYQNGDVLLKTAFVNKTAAVSSSAPVDFDGYTFLYTYKDADCTLDDCGTIYNRPTNGQNIVVYSKYIEGDWTVVDNKKAVTDMFNYMALSTRKYYIRKDITFDGKVAVLNNVNATIEGNGHTISGITFTSATLKAGNVSSVFGTFGASANIKNLTFSDVSIEFKVSTGPVSIYGICKDVTDGATFENFKIDGFNVKISKPDSVMVTNIPDVNNKQNWLFGGVIAGGDSIATDSAFMAKYPGIIVENAVLEI